MTRLLGAVLLLMSGTVFADELADANLLLAQKSYDKAFAIYQKLANAGNAEAQMHLGEMYWFGDGTAANLTEAKMWSEKSAASGNADAVANLASLKRRETHANEIVYWTRLYDGADMVSGKFACKPPDIPFVSETKRFIQSAAASMDAYRQCFNGFVDNMKDAAPSIRHIPTETLDMMTPAEVAQARTHLDMVYTRIAADARTQALAFIAQEGIWLQKTRQYVKSYNDRLEFERILIRYFGGLAAALKGSGS